jgi:hypothetical protein
MKVIYTGEDMPNTITKSLFMAGGSKRPGQEDMTSWRSEALFLLNAKGFDGTVFCPEPKDGKFNKDFNYNNQIEWEEEGLTKSNCILFWFARDLSLGKDGRVKLGCLISNIEWGVWCNSGKVVLGAPDNADKMGYIKYYAKKYNVPTSNSLSGTIDNALIMIDGRSYIDLYY